MEFQSAHKRVISCATIRRRVLASGLWSRRPLQVINCLSPNHSSTVGANSAKLAFRTFRRMGNVLFTDKSRFELKTHGGPSEPVRHVGDLGNMNATTGERTTFSFFDNVISFNGDTNILGRAIVIHENADDFGRGNFADSNSTGHAGSRLVCGVINKSSATSYSASVFTLVISLLVFSKNYVD